MLTRAAAAVRPTARRILHPTAILNPSHTATQRIHQIVRSLHSSHSKMTEVGVDPPTQPVDTIFGKISRGELGTKFLSEQQQQHTQHTGTDMWHAPNKPIDVF